MLQQSIIQHLQLQIQTFGKLLFAVTILLYFQDYCHTIRYILSLFSVLLGLNDPDLVHKS